MLRDTAVERRAAIDRARATTNLSPVQRYVPHPGDTTEEKLWSECYGSGGEAFPRGLKICLDAVRWDLDEGEDQATEVVLTTPGRERRKELIRLEMVLIVTLRPFASLRTKSIWEILELGDESASEVVSELRSKGARFSVFDPKGQQDVQGNRNLPQARDWNYVFASWLEDREQGAAGTGSDAATAGQIPGAGLSRAVRERLSEQEITTKELDAMRNPASFPTDDKLIAFSARHLIALEAFSAVSILDAAYDRRRNAIPSPHTLPEERGAARLEALSIELAKDGHLRQRVRRVHRDQIMLCADQSFLQYVAACIAAGRLLWEADDPIKHTGQWMLDAGTERVSLGGPEDLAAALGRILTAAESHESRQARAGLERVGWSASTGPRPGLRRRPSERARHAETGRAGYAVLGRLTLRAPRVVTALRRVDRVAALPATSLA